MELTALVGVTKTFGKVTALDNVDLEVMPGEFFSVLGPSGSGKTTVLRILAGFEQPDWGKVTVDGIDVTGVPPFERAVNTVFQDYALFPHMSVSENVEYGLMVTGIGKVERRERAMTMLTTVRLDGVHERRPSQLSGGQRQRVALARALVNEPKVLLLDEPLGALDFRLREDMQVELKSIQTTLGITFVYVTHDQGEALSMSDRVAVFNNGRVEQVGTPRDIYERPATPFVAGFVGDNNYLDVETATLFGLPTHDGARHVRPQFVTVSPSGGDVAGTVHAVQYLGAESRVHVVLDNGTKVMSLGASRLYSTLSTGQRIWVCIEDTSQGES